MIVSKIGMLISTIGTARVNVVAVFRGGLDRQGAGEKTDRHAAGVAHENLGGGQL